MRAVIMAGGKGTRLSKLNSEIPKPMFPVMDKPILEYQIESLVRCGITDITIIVGYLKDVIIDKFRNGKNYGVNITYIEEKEPLGTAGALFYLKEEKDDFILIFGDLILDVDFTRFMDFHKKNGAGITLFVHPNSHPHDSDVIVSEDGLVTDILSKTNSRDFFYHNLVNAGLYCIAPRILKGIDCPSKIDLEKGIIRKLIDKREVYAYRSTEYVKDMGTPERLMDVVSDVKNGVVRARSLRNKQKAIFLDRDGTINEYVGFLRKITDFKLLPKSAQAITEINTSPFLAIVTTNQPVIARGEISVGELEDIHKKMETELGKQGAFLDDVFYCPHHPDSGYIGEIKELKFECDCRKPKIGMLTRAADKYNIDLSQSWYIGDTTVDIQTGRNAGMHTVLLCTGEGGKDRKFDVAPDYVAQDLLEAVQFILNTEIR